MSGGPGCRAPIFVHCAQVCLATRAFCGVKLDVYKGGQAGLYLFKKFPFAREIPICRGDSLQVDFTENDSIGQFSRPLPKAATAPWTAFLPANVVQTGAQGLSGKTNPSGTCLLAPESPSFFFAPPPGQVSAMTSSVFSIWFSSGCSPFFAAESSVLCSLLLLLLLECTLPLCHSHPSLLLPHNTVEAAASCTWLCLLAWGQKAGTWWPCSVWQLTTASVWKTGSGSSVSEVGAWRSLHIIPGGLLSILATKSYDIPTIPWLMEIPASVLLPQAGLAHSQSAQIEEGWCVWKKSAP